MITRILISVLVLPCSHTYAQDFVSKSISLKIQEDSLVCTKPCRAVTVSMTFTNQSSKDILVYGLKKGGPHPTFDLFRACDVKATGTGMAFAIFAGNGSQKIPKFEIIDRIGQKKVTREDVDSTLRVMNLQFLESAKVLQKGEGLSLVRELPLQGFNLPSGSYHLQIVYYCGNNTSEMLNRNEVKRQAELFQGCAASSKIPLIVR